jgi:hypothetical protein
MLGFSAMVMSRVVYLEVFVLLLVETPHRLLTDWGFLQRSAVTQRQKLRAWTWRKSTI